MAARYDDDVADPSPAGEVAGIETRATRLLGVRLPIVQGGLARVAFADLAAAVSNAGALGTIGSVGASPRHLREQIRRCREATTKPFAVNIITWEIAPVAGRWVDVAIEERVPVVTLSFGDTLPALERCRSAGLRTIVQVQGLAGARAAIAPGRTS